jgi:hypothetical protein
MKTFSALLNGPNMNMQQSHSDPCIFYKHKGGKLVLILVLYVDDTLCTGKRVEVEWAYKIIESKLKIGRQRQLKKHLGMWYNWKENKTGKHNRKLTCQRWWKRFVESIMNLQEREPRNLAHQEHQERLRMKEKG